MITKLNFTDRTIKSISLERNKNKITSNNLINN